MADATTSGAADASPTREQLKEFARTLRNAIEEGAACPPASHLPRVDLRWGQPVLLAFLTAQLTPELVQSRDTEAALAYLRDAAEQAAEPEEEFDDHLLGPPGATGSDQGWTQPVPGPAAPAGDHGEVFRFTELQGVLKRFAEPTPGWSDTLATAWQIILPGTAPARLQGRLHVRLGRLGFSDKDTKHFCGLRWSSIPADRWERQIVGRPGHVRTPKQHWEGFCRELARVLDLGSHDGWDPMVASINGEMELFELRETDPLFAEVRDAVWHELGNACLDVLEAVIDGLDVPSPFSRLFETLPLRVTHILSRGLVVRANRSQAAPGSARPSRTPGPSFPASKQKPKVTSAKALLGDEFAKVQAAGVNANGLLHPGRLRTVPDKARYGRMPTAAERDRPDLIAPGINVAAIKAAQAKAAAEADA